MDRKPWQMNGPHRGGSDRVFEGRRSDRREDRGSDRREDRRFSRFDDEGRAGRRDGARRPFENRDRGFERRGAPRFKREEFATRSGPRARAAQERRFADKSAFEKNAVVRLAPDVAAHFENAEQVNDALRRLIEAAALLKKSEPAKPAAPEADIVDAKDAQAVFAADPFDDDVESDEYDSSAKKPEVEAE